MARSRSTHPLIRSPLAIRVRALLVSFLAAFVVFAQLLGAGHLTLVTHRLCEHGALLHANALEDEARDEGASAGASDEQQVHRAAAHAEHEHCDALALKPATVAVGPCCSVPVFLGEWILAFDGSGPVADRAVAVLAFAPKSSPPESSAS